MFTFFSFHNSTYHPKQNYFPPQINKMFKIQEVYCHVHRKAQMVTQSNEILTLQVPFTQPKESNNKQKQCFVDLVAYMWVETELKVRVVVTLSTVIVNTVSIHISI